MGIKSRWGWIVPECRKVDCLNRNTPICDNCVPMFDYKKKSEGRKKEVDDNMREVPGQSLPKNKKTLRSS